VKPDNELRNHLHNQGQISKHEQLEEQTPKTRGEKICITAQGSDLDSPIDPRFGRAQYFIVFDPGGLKIEAIRNPNAEESHGVGIKSAQLLAGKGVKTILTGHVGPKAGQVLKSAGIQCITGLTGRVREAYNDFINQTNDVG